MTEQLVTPSANETAGPAGGRLPWGPLWLVLIALAAVGTVAIPLVQRQSMQAGVFLFSLAFLVCLVAAWFDAGTGRIADALTYTAILVGLGVNLLLGPLLGGMGFSHGAMAAAATPLSCVEGFAMCAAIGLGIVLCGQGGGDMKLMTALGAMLGMQVGGVLLWALAVAVPFALVNLILAGRLNAALQMLGVQMLTLVFLHERPVVGVVSKRTIPMALPLVAGLVLARALPGVVL